MYFTWNNSIIQTLEPSKKYRLKYKIGIDVHMCSRVKCYQCISNVRFVHAMMAKSNKIAFKKVTKSVMSCSIITNGIKTWDYSEVCDKQQGKYRSRHGLPYGDYRISIIQIFSLSKCYVLLGLVKGVWIIEVGPYYKALSLDQLIPSLNVSLAQQKHETVLACALFPVPMYSLLNFRGLVQSMMEIYGNITAAARDLFWS